jgi:hypothetical protein
MKWRPGILIFLSFIALFYSGFLMETPRANAGYFSDLFNGVKQLSELPGEVDELKANYQVTLDKLDEAQSTLDRYFTQNQELAERNKELAAMVVSLRQEQEAREASIRKTKTWLITGASLLVGYFILLRGLRFILRK